VVCSVISVSARSSVPDGTLIRKREAPCTPCGSGAGTVTIFARAPANSAAAVRTAVAALGDPS
jgi:hypothetical protein